MEATSSIDAVHWFTALRAERVMISLSGLHIAQAIKIPNICGLHHSVLSQHHPGNSCWTARSPFQGRCVPGQTLCCRCRLQPLVRVYLVVWQHEQDDALPCDEILELLNTTALSPLFSFPPIFFTKHLQWFVKRRLQHIRAWFWSCRTPR